MIWTALVISKFLIPAPKNERPGGVRSNRGHRGGRHRCRRSGPLHEEELSGSPHEYRPRSRMPPRWTVERSIYDRDRAADRIRALSVARPHTIQTNCLPVQYPCARAVPVTDDL